MKTWTFNDGMRSGGRHPKLWLVKGGAIFHFEGIDIPSVAVIESSTYGQNGKWSSTTYRIKTGDNTVAVELLAPLHGKTWSQGSVTEALAWLRKITGQEVAEADFRKALAQDYPKTLARWDEVASRLAELD